ncbi:MAG TPA: hypothetical protein VF829_03135 [Candidatus Paceibacterota bacterium]
MYTDSLQEFRCSCGKLLFRGSLRISTIEIKCKRCGEVHTFEDASGAQALRFRSLTDLAPLLRDGPDHIDAAGYLVIASPDSLLQGAV